MKDERGDGRLRRQGAEPAEPRAVATGRRRRRAGEIHRIRSVIDRVAERRVHADRLGVGGAPARGQPHQALPAALQRPAQGRQELPVHQGHPRRRLPADRAHAQARQRRQPVLRAVRVGDERRRVDEPGPPALPVPDLHDRHQGRRAGAPAAVPAVPHQALPGPVHPGDLEGRLPGRHRPGRALPRGPPGDARQGARAARWRRPPPARTTSSAAVLRDKIRAIERTMESQKMAAFAKTELDLVGLARADNQAAVQLFAIRDGKMVGRDVFLLDAAREASDDEVLASFLEQYYARATSIPREVYLPSTATDVADLEAFLAERRGGPVHLRVAQRGEKRRADGPRGAQRRRDACARAGPLAGRPGQDPCCAPGAGRRARPRRRRRRASSATTSATSRAANRSAAWSSSRTASPARGEYRRFRIRTVEGPNDFASHQEVLRRRFRTVKAGQEGSDEERRWAMPDLVVIDGGRGQVSAAKAVLDELGLHDLAARRPGQGARGAVPARPAGPDRPAGDVTGALPRPAAARRGAPLRDHLSPRPAGRSGRSGRAFDDLPGVGPKRKRELLKVFGSIKRVREAPVEQIAAVPGIGRALAERIKATLEA